MSSVYYGMVVCYEYLVAVLLLEGGILDKLCQGTGQEGEEMHRIPVTMEK